MLSWTPAPVHTASADLQFSDEPLLELQDAELRLEGVHKHWVAGAARLLSQNGCHTIAQNQDTLVQ